MSNAPINKIIFITNSDTDKGPMAAAALSMCALTKTYEIESRGLTVLFPEPMNEKAEAVLISNGFAKNDFHSAALSDEDFSDDTLMITLSRENFEQMLEKYPDKSSSIQLLEELTGTPVEYENLHGRELNEYGRCFEDMMKDMSLLAAYLNERHKEQ